MDRLKIKEKIKEAYQRGPKKPKKISFLTGAGISSESGIPTYRGIDGIWIKGTQFHKPEEFGTFKYFSNNPKEVWQYTLFRMGMFEKAQPNKGHIALAHIESLLQDNFHLITQNIDGLHYKAGNTPLRTYEIHGSLRTIRCSNNCSKDIYPLPMGLKSKGIDEEITEDEWQLLKCPICGCITRPNILWFDETYNERLFKLYSALKVAKSSGVLFIIGTAGATNLPNQIVAQALKYGGMVVDINIEDNVFSRMLENKKNGMIIRANSSDALQEIDGIIKEVLESTP